MRTPMKFASVLLALLAVTPAAIAAETPYLSSAALNIAELRPLEKELAIPSNLSVSATLVALEKFRKSSGFDSLAERYDGDLLRVLKVSSPLDWMTANPKTYAALNAYVDDPGNADVPIWQSTNEKLRAGTPLGTAEAGFKRGLLAAMAAMPYYRGIAFRGSALRAETLLRYETAWKNKVPYTDAAFVSTSIDPEIALKFSRPGPDKAAATERTATVFVLALSRGTPVSFFHPDHWVEKEYLVAPGTAFEVKRVVRDLNARKAIVFMIQK